MTITNVITRPANRMKKTDRTFGVEIEFGLKRDIKGIFQRCTRGF